MNSPVETILTRRLKAKSHHVPLYTNHSRIWVTVSLVFSDLVAFLISGMLAVAGRGLLGLGWQIQLLPQALLLFVPCTIIYQLAGLYPTLGVGSVEELRRLTVTTTTVMLGVTGLTFFLRNAEEFSRMTVALTWLFSLALIPICRSIARTIGSRFSFWSRPVVIIGYRRQGPSLVNYLRANRKLGLEPVLALDGFGNNHNGEVDIPIFSAVTALKDDRFSKSIDVDTAILIASDVPVEVMNSLAQRQIGGFKHLILIPNLGKFKTVGVSTVEIGSVLGLRAKYNLYNEWEATLKRIIDIVLVSVGIVLAAPIIALIGLLIKLDSRGSVFFAHTRIGKDNKKFMMWKFRTMVVNADQLLEAHLHADEDLESEWNLYQKLKDDPRVTRAGGLLRRFSLDELPQLWNVLRGEMSLVGPRPITDSEIDKYGESFTFYQKVKPGITGLWQVSGRNDTEYDTRVALDEYYVRNWSVWLDVSILARTPWAVIRRDGAY